MQGMVVALERAGVELQRRGRRRRREAGRPRRAREGERLLLRTEVELPGWLVAGEAEVVA